MPKSSGIPLREDLDIHSSINSMKLLREGIDAHYDCLTVGFAADGHSLLLDLPSNYWTQEFTRVPPAVYNGQVRCPPTVHTLDIVSKQAYKYPVMFARTQLPDHTVLTGNPTLWLGLENSAAPTTGILAFQYAGLIETLNIRAGAMTPGASNKTVGITGLLPVTYKTEENTYSVVVTERGAEFYINHVLSVLVLFSPHLAFTTINGPPYSIISLQHPKPASWHTTLEVSGDGNDYIIPMTWFGYGIIEGDPRPPRLYRLYDAATEDLFAGLTIDAGLETSHPFPLFGFDNKTLYFRADQDGDLDIEILLETGNWRVYDPDVGGHTNSNYTAGDLEIYNIAAEAVLARIVFDPDAYPCTISEAEVALR